MSGDDHGHHDDGDNDVQPPGGLLGGSGNFLPAFVVFQLTALTGGR